MLPGLHARLCHAIYKIWVCAHASAVMLHTVYLFIFLIFSCARKNAMTVINIFEPCYLTCRNGRGLEAPCILPVTDGDRVLLQEKQSLGSQKKVFPAKSRPIAGPATSRSVAVGLALVVLAAAGVPHGWKVAEVVGSSTSEAARLLLPMGLRSVITSQNLGCKLIVTYVPVDSTLQPHMHGACAWLSAAMRAWLCAFGICDIIQRQSLTRACSVQGCDDSSSGGLASGPSDSAALNGLACAAGAAGVLCHASHCSSGDTEECKSGGNSTYDATPALAVSCRVWGIWHAADCRSAVSVDGCQPHADASSTNRSCAGAAGWGGCIWLVAGTVLVLSILCCSIEVSPRPPSLLSRSVGYYHPACLGTPYIYMDEIAITLVLADLNCNNHDIDVSIHCGCNNTLISSMTAIAGFSDFPNRYLPLRGVNMRLWLTPSNKPSSAWNKGVKSLYFFLATCTCICYVNVRSLPAAKT